MKKYLLPLLLIAMVCGVFWTLNSAEQNQLNVGDTWSLGDFSLTVTSIQGDDVSLGIRIDGSDLLPCHAKKGQVLSFLSSTPKFVKGTLNMN